MAFTLSAGMALLASISAVAAVPFPGASFLQPRQATMPDHCTNYCSVGAGCVCIIRPTNCVANYTVEDGDSCTSIVAKYQSFRATDLYAWNPEIGRECFGLQSHVPVCIDVTGYTYPGPVEGGEIWTPEQTPVPVQPGIVSNCTQFEFTDSSGKPGFAALLRSNGITQAQWNAWNYPSQNDTGDWSLWAGYFSCVKA